MNIADITLKQRHKATEEIQPPNLHSPESFRATGRSVITKGTACSQTDTQCRGFGITVESSYESRLIFYGRKQISYQ